MSTSEVIDKFVGQFHSIEKVVNEDPDKDRYYPDVGVKLRLDKIILSGTTGGKAYAKIKIDPSGEAFEAQLQLELAVFEVENNTLVARNIEVSPGLLLQETLTMGAEGMTHTLKFSDGSLGSWICVPKH